MLHMGWLYQFYTKLHFYTWGNSGLNPMVYYDHNYTANSNYFKVEYFCTDIYHSHEVHTSNLNFSHPTSTSTSTSTYNVNIYAPIILMDLYTYPDGNTADDNIQGSDFFGDYGINNRSASS